MANGASTSAISGAAQGAVSGAMIGGVPGAIAGGIIGGIGGLISGGSADAQNANQSAWARYNVGMQLNTDLYNINSRYNISAMNAGMQMGIAGIKNQAIAANADYNAALQVSTTMYQNLLLEQELARVWQDEDLDLEQLENYRARERGTMVADQAASGTVIGQDSNADAVISQQTQEAMDANIIMFDADRKAADIANAKAQNTWNGRVKVQQIMWDGQVQQYVNAANAGIQSASIMATANIQKRADTYTAHQNAYMGGIAIDMGNSQYQAQNVQNMVGGLFSAGAQAGAMYYNSKVPTINTPSNAPTLISRSAPTYTTGSANLTYASMPAPKTGGAGSSLLGPL